MELVVDRDSKGTLHNSAPVSGFTPMKFCCENNNRCRVPPMSAMIGDP